MSTVGFPDSTVRESRDRVRTAIRNAGIVDSLAQSWGERKHFMNKRLKGEKKS